MHEDPTVDLELNSVTAKTDDFFSSTTPLQEMTPEPEEEPELFKDNDVSVFKDIKPETEQTPEPMVMEEEEDIKPTFIERVIGISRARKKHDTTSRPDIKLSSNENDTPAAVVNDDLDISGDDLDIPSFLRRK